jgi:MoCo/4Fe-4S cofactor protein with predicted Tat translocation signal
MSTQKKYWKGLSELNESPEFLNSRNNEFAEPLPIDEFLNDSKIADSKTSRRDFLKFVGFSTAAATLASCETPVTTSIPYVVKPETIYPGVATWYATTFFDGNDYADVLVKTREGRPIKVEGNDASSVNGGGTNARIQASVLSLYDSARLTGPMIGGQSATWKNADMEVLKALNAAKASGKRIAILSSTIISPSAKAIIRGFEANYGKVYHVQYDAVSYAAIRYANQNTFGKSVIPSYNFDQSKVIVGIACDFLGNWLSPVEYTRQYASVRKVSKEKKEMAKHYHFEANMSLTGANADERYMVKPSEFGKIALALYNEVAKQTGGSASAAAALSPEASKAVAKAAKDLVAHKGASLVVSGANDENTQSLVNGINQMLGNYGATINIDRENLTRQGDDRAFLDLIADMNAGNVGAMVLLNTNPLYTAPVASKFVEAFNKVPFKVACSLYNDETTKACNVAAPTHHYLESWDDASAFKGLASLAQPTISPLFASPRYEGTRQYQESLLAWQGKSMAYSDFLKNNWYVTVYPNQNRFGDFNSFWANALHDGVVNLSSTPDVVLTAKQPVSDSIKNLITPFLGAFTGNNLKGEGLEAVSMVATTPSNTFSMSTAATAVNAAKTDKWEVALYEKVSMGAGVQANNPWLQEMPDPITKTTWDNYITMSPEDVKTENLSGLLRQDRMASMIDITINGIAYKNVPVLPQPGQAKGTLGLAFGYGRKVDNMKVASEAKGFNAFPALALTNGSMSSYTTGTFTKASGEYEIACTQIHHTIMGREESILRETTLSTYKTKPQDVWNPDVTIVTHSGKTPVEKVDLWAEHARPGHKWGMVIDLNGCVGCGACVVACTAENNVAVVGKDQVKRTREMHWLRIDRYYSSDMTAEKAETDHLGLVDKYLEMENPSNNPKVTFQPLMCQHCNHAPCETVCPVIATNHSSEGLNQMTYNRCVGTRYCANNCPFKVRRFNWYNNTNDELFAGINPSQDDLGRMVLNPDVTVRTRGVMEKCSMCVQRIQAGKLKSKKEGHALVDGAIKTACQTACAAGAIHFGDLNDEKSGVSAIRADERNFFMLEEVGVKPTVSYLVKVRNEEEKAEA